MNAGGASFTLATACCREFDRTCTFSALRSRRISPSIRNLYVGCTTQETSFHTDGSMIQTEMRYRRLLLSEEHCNMACHGNLSVLVCVAVRGYF